MRNYDNDNYNDNDNTIQWYLLSGRLNGTSANYEANT